MNRLLLWATGAHLNLPHQEAGIGKHQLISLTVVGVNTLVLLAFSMYRQSMVPWAQIILSQRDMAAISIHRFCL